MQALVLVTQVGRGSVRFRLVFALPLLVSRGVKMYKMGTSRWLQKLWCVAEAVYVKKWL